MKLQRLLLSLSLCGLTFSHAAAQDTTLPSSRSIGDSPNVRTRSIGDTTAQPYATNAGNARPHSASPQVSLKSKRSISDSGATTGHRLISDGPGHAHAVDMGILAPTAIAASHASDGKACDTSSCDDGCDGLGILGRIKNSDVWMSTELLLWFTENQPAPPLVTTSAQGVLPVYNGANVTTAFGGPDGIENGLIPGFRTEIGKWLDCDQKIGISARGYGFIEAEEFNATSDGTTSIGIPFFNANPGVLDEDAYLAAFTNLLFQPVSSGTVWARSDLDLIGLEGSARYLIARGSNRRFDFITGYTFNHLKSSISVRSQSTDLFTGNLIPDGTVFDILDQFSTANQFHGGHLGVLSNVTRKGLTLSSLAKVSMGNTRSTGDIFGSTTTTPPAGTAVTTAGGTFARASNIGPMASVDNFSFISELGVKLGANLNENVQATVGYSLMYWSSVALAGDQMDRVIDPAGGVNRPVHNGIVTQGMWAQGIDLGLIFNY